VINATILKKFVVEKFGVKRDRVRVNGGKHFVSVMILADNRESERHHEKMVYSALFPFSFGQHCLRVIYPENPKLHENWCGNVTPQNIAMHRDEWEKVLKEYEEPVPV